jgi:hypothetical protein
MRHISTPILSQIDLDDSGSAQNALLDSLFPGTGTRSRDSQIYCLSDLLACFAVSRRTSRDNSSTKFLPPNSYFLGLLKDMLPPDALKTLEGK